MNCDGAVDLADVGPFSMALTDATAYAAAFPNCDIGLPDVNDDGVNNGRDIRNFVSVLLGL